ncbi:oxidoreductase [Prauserella sp. PE36]|uniref:ferredoxin--NADP reductase n=1 Tax=Prauserella sp. PE36 TaxID=1504709 RepID=UPI000DE1E6D0|nr:ferredoxin--NADP reductase [Prauserella sp. PE36]RBM21882.1 oxidoreductase [Prauserella sp. PE36]
MVDRDDVRRAHGYHTLRVTRIVQETPDTRSFVLEVPAELAETFRYLPGQFCTFRVTVDGTEQLRSYSMSSAPDTGDDLTVTVKRVPGGVVSNWLNDTVAEGDVLELTRPAGVFCPREGGHPVVAFCGGSGVTPVLSIAKSVLAATDRTVRLFYANRNPESVIFAGELDRLRERYPDRLEVRHHHDSVDGYPDAGAVTEFAGASAGADYYVCGPAPFMDLVESTLRATGADPGRILVERFGDAAPAEPEQRAAGPEVPEAVTLILNGKKTTVAYKAGDTVLETARRGGLQPPFSCEAGNCATCMAVLRDGSATMRANNALTEEEVAEGWVLTCQALPQGPGSVTVEYEAF